VRIDSVFEFCSCYFELSRFLIWILTSQHINIVSNAISNGEYMALRLKDMMKKDVVTVGTDATVRKTIELMSQHQIGCIVVMGPIGIVTESDLVRKVLNQSKDPEKTFVGEIMSMPLAVGHPEMSIEEAMQAMTNRNIKKLPITENERLLGVITITDLIRSPEIIKTLGKTPASESRKRPKVANGMSTEDKATAPALLT